MSIYFENGVERGFGTFPLKGDELAEAVGHAWKVGYRAYDTAQMYQNEADLRSAFGKLGVDPGEAFITTKVHPDNYGDADFMPSVEKSLEALGRDAADVLLLHWPPADGAIDKPLELLAEAKSRGFARAIGVSNFNSAMMRRSVDVLGEAPACNQVEFHPLLNQEALLAASKEIGIPLVSYCSVARGEILDYPELAEVGEAHGRTAVQAALRWILQKGVALNTMSTKPGNIGKNFAIDDFSLSDGDMARIDALTSANHRIVTSERVPWAPEWD